MESPKLPSFSDAIDVIGMGPFQSRLVFVSGVVSSVQISGFPFFSASCFRRTSWASCYEGEHMSKNDDDCGIESHGAEFGCLGETGNVPILPGKMISDTRAART